MPPGGFNLIALIALASDAIAERIIAWGRPPYWPDTMDDPRPAQLLAGDVAPVDFWKVAAGSENIATGGKGSEQATRRVTNTNEAIARSHSGGL